MPLAAVSGDRSSWEASDTNWRCRINPESRRSNMSFRVTVNAAISSPESGTGRRSPELDGAMRRASAEMRRTGSRAAPSADHNARPPIRTSRGTMMAMARASRSTLRPIIPSGLKATNVSSSPVGVATVLVVSNQSPASSSSKGTGSRRSSSTSAGSSSRLETAIPPEASSATPTLKLTMSLSDSSPDSSASSSSSGISPKNSKIEPSGVVTVYP